GRVERRLHDGEARQHRSGAGLRFPGGPGRSLHRPGDSRAAPPVAVENVRRGACVVNRKQANDLRVCRAKLALGVAAAVSAVAFAGQRPASACGGCFHPPTQTVSDITDERMLLTVSATQTTLYDQIEYSGSPTSFAWVLPIHGSVTVGLSADVLFNSIDT